MALTTSEASHLKVLRLLQENPEISQREVAEALGISLGKANYCLKALIGRGLVKAHNFRTAKNKRAYAYLLTPEGIRRKAGLTVTYLSMKMAEYDALKMEIEQLKKDLVHTKENVSDSQLKT
jgi:MarR family transcriptional regulator, temperature-dependent positive regulator of motility